MTALSTWTTTQHPARSVRVLTALVLSLSAGCAKAGSQQADQTGRPNTVEAVARRVVLLGESADPVFFLGPESDAPALAFGGSGTKLILRGPSDNGRVPVRVHGRVTLEAYVPEALFELRAQRAVELPGTLVKLSPGDHVRLVPGSQAEGRARVAAMVKVGPAQVGPFEAELPLELLAANTPQQNADPKPTPGIQYMLPSQTALPLFDAPDGELKTLIPMLSDAMVIKVHSVTATGFWVELGQGPRLVGFTSAPLQLLGSSTPPPQGAQQVAAEAHGVPARIARASGPLKRVAHGTKVRFRGQEIATFRSEGFARVLQSHGDDVEVFAAADDGLSLRGIVHPDALSDAQEAPQAAGVLHADDKRSEDAGASEHEPEQDALKLAPARI